MVATCHALGMLPLTLEEFRKEDQRILSDMVRRRSGLTDSLGGFGAQQNLSTYR